MDHKTETVPELLTFRSFKSQFTRKFEKMHNRSEDDFLIHLVLKKHKKKKENTDEDINNLIDLTPKNKYETIFL